MSRFLITGSSGMIAQLLKVKLQQNYPNTEIWTLSRKASRERHIQIDLLDRNLGEAINFLKPSVVFHLAGKMGISESFIFPKRFMDSNYHATQNLVRALTPDAHCQFVYFNSSAIYSSSIEGEVHEESPAQPTSPYGVSKLLAEKYIRNYSRSTGFSWTSLTLSNCYGPIAMMNQGVIKNFVQSILENKSPVITGRDTARDFIYIDDVVDAALKVIDNPTNSRLHISTNSSISLFELYNEIRKILGSRLKPEIQQRPFGHPRSLTLNNSLAKSKLSWTPKVNLQFGLRSAIEVALTRNSS